MLTINRIATCLLLVAAILFFVFGLIGHRDTGAGRERELRALVHQAGLRPLGAGPPIDPALFALGEALFFDKELSGDRDIACATCHHPANGTTDGLPLAVGTGGTGTGAARQPGSGHPFVGRNTSDLFNRGLDGWQTLLWDGRVSGRAEDGFTHDTGTPLPEGLNHILAAQLLLPLVNRDEMRGGLYRAAGYGVEPGTILADGPNPSEPDIGDENNELALLPDDPAHWPAVWEGVMDRLLRIPGYRALFLEAYPDVAPEALQIQHAANALAAYIGSAFVAVQTPWDRYLAGDPNALSYEAKAGAILFLGRAGCSTCHTGDLLTDQAYHNIAVPQFGPGIDAHVPLDYGRYHVTGDPSDRYAFRTPPLRNVALTGPWFHNGAYDRLADVIRHHNRPADALRRYDGRSLPPELQATLQDHPVTIETILETLDPVLLAPSPLTEREVAQLVAFLEALTDPAAAELDPLIPAAVPSGLPVD